MDNFRMPERVEGTSHLLKTVGKSDAEKKQLDPGTGSAEAVERRADFAELAKKTRMTAALLKRRQSGLVVRGQTPPEFEKVAILAQAERAEAVW